jgi:hypothetical protein
VAPAAEESSDTSDNGWSFSSVWSLWGDEQDQADLLAAASVVETQTAEPAKTMWIRTFRGSQVSSVAVVGD